MAESSSFLAAAFVAGVVADDVDDSFVPFVSKPPVVWFWISFKLIDCLTEAARAIALKLNEIG